MDVAQEGDRVLLLSRDHKTYSITLRAGSKVHTHQGIVAHDDLIGHPLGRQVKSHLERAFLAMPPSTYDLIRLTRRTSQIMFPKDIGYILLRLDIYPGVRVIEAGTGSGGLTTALARMVQPHGQVYSYEQREEIQQVARENIQALGLAAQVTFHVRNITDGFEESDVDALFLDLRDPWNYVSQAFAALRGGGFFGAIVPTTNQVSRLLHDLRVGGFAALEVEELLVRPYKTVAARLRPMDRMIAHTGYLVFARKVLDDLGDEWFMSNRGRSRAHERGNQDDDWVDEELG